MVDNDLCETPQPTQQSILNRTGKDKFILVVNLPSVLRRRINNDTTLDLNSLQMSIHGTVVPNVQVPSVEVPFGGQTYNVSSHIRPNYPPLMVNFILDNAFKNYWTLWNWLKVLNDPSESVYTGTLENSKKIYEKVEDGNLKEYQTNLSVLGLNEYNQPTIEFTYYNAFITNLGGITYSYRDPEIIESTAEFQFSQLDVKLLS